MEDYMSGYLEDFINFLDTANEQLAMSNADFDESNIELQDLQHFIEFGHPDARGMVKVYKVYHETRQKRRTAKENIELCAPIVEWYAKYGKAIQELRGVLGAVRKIERQQATRSYAIRTHILDDITTKTHLYGRNYGSGDNGVG